MTFSGRESERLIAKGITALERLARASEQQAKASDKLLELAQKELPEFEELGVIQAGPPVCPYCGYMNPEVHVQERTGSGPMLEYVVPFQCGECQMTFIAIPDGWDTAQSPDEAAAIIQGRKGLTNGGNSGSDLLDT